METQPKVPLPPTVNKEILSSRGKMFEVSILPHASITKPCHARLDRFHKSAQTFPNQQENSKSTNLYSVIPSKVPEGLEVYPAWAPLSQPAVHFNGTIQYGERCTQIQIPVKKHLLSLASLSTTLTDWHFPFQFSAEALFNLGKIYSVLSYKTISVRTKLFCFIKLLTYLCL